jgi:NADH-quinone oxidoreductase subunit I
MIKEFIQGLSITARHLLPGNSTTVEYPKVKYQPGERYRGLHRLVPDQDREKCVACYLCATACPAKCITIEADEDHDGKKYPSVYQIDLLRCIFCGYCVEACPVEAIEMTGEYELANLKREDFCFTKERLLK